MIELDGATEG